MLPPENSKAFRYLALAALILFIIIGLKYTAYIVTIILVSLILTMLALPAMNGLTRRGVHPIAAVSLLTLVAIAFFALLGTMTVVSFWVLVRDLPLYQVQFEQRIAEITGMLPAAGLSTTMVPPTPDLSEVVGMVVSSAMELWDLMMYLFFIAITTIFMVLEAPKIAARMHHVPGMTREKAARISQMSKYTIDFVIVRTKTNLVHGVLFGGILYAMGVHAAILWGVLTFVLSYIPFIGLIIASIPAIFFAWLQFGIWGAVAVIAVVCVLNLIVENPVFSYFAAQTYEMPALVVIISVVVWGWLFGMTGMVFAVPITLLLCIMIQFVDELAWVNTVMGVDRLFGMQKEGGMEESGTQGEGGEGG